MNDNRTLVKDVPFQTMITIDLNINQANSVPPHACRLLLSKVLIAFQNKIFQVANASKSLFYFDSPNLPMAKWVLKYYTEKIIFTQMSIFSKSLYDVTRCFMICGK